MKETNFDYSNSYGLQASAYNVALSATSGWRYNKRRVSNRDCHVSLCMSMRKHAAHCWPITRELRIGAEWQIEQMFVVDVPQSIERRIDAPLIPNRRVVLLGGNVFAVGTYKHDKSSNFFNLPFNRNPHFPSCEVHCNLAFIQRLDLCRRLLVWLSTERKGWVWGASLECCIVLQMLYLQG